MESKKCPNLINLSQIWLKTHYFDSNLGVRGTFLTPCVRALNEIILRYFSDVFSLVCYYHFAFFYLPILTGGFFTYLYLYLSLRIGPSFFTRRLFTVYFYPLLFRSFSKCWVAPANKAWKTQSLSLSLQRASESKIYNIPWIKKKTKLLNHRLSSCVPKKKM